MRNDRRASLRRHANGGIGGGEQSLLLEVVRDAYREVPRVRIIF